MEDERQKRIKKEIARIKKLFKEMDSEKMKLAEQLIINASFMVITLQDLMEKINKEGIKEFYQNGESQSGYKESIEVKTYNTMIKNYMNIIKQLNEMLPVNKKIDKLDDFEIFNR